MSDHNYHNKPELIQKLVDELGGIAGILAFCQTNAVRVVSTPEGLAGCVVFGEPGYWATDLDAFSALVMGIKKFKDHHKPVQKHDNGKAYEATLANGKVVKFVTDSAGKVVISTDSAKRLVGMSIADVTAKFAEHGITVVELPTIPATC